MCGVEDDVLIPCCENGHYLHRECCELIVSHAFPAPFVCPMCRSDAIYKMCTCSSILSIMACGDPGLLALSIGVFEYNNFN